MPGTPCGNDELSRECVARCCSPASLRHHQSACGCRFEISSKHTWLYMSRFGKVYCHFLLLGLWSRHCNGTFKVTRVMLYKSVTWTILHLAGYVNVEELASSLATIRCLRSGRRDRPFFSISDGFGSYSLWSATMKSWGWNGMRETTISRKPIADWHCSGILVSLYPATGTLSDQDQLRCSSECDRAFRQHGSLCALGLYNDPSILWSRTFTVLYCGYELWSWSPFSLNRQELGQCWGSIRALQAHSGSLWCPEWPSRKSLVHVLHKLHIINVCTYYSCTWCYPYTILLGLEWSHWKQWGRGYLLSGYTTTHISG